MSYGLITCYSTVCAYIPAQNEKGNSSDCLFVKTKIQITNITFVFVNIKMHVQANDYSRSPSVHRPHREKTKSDPQIQNPHTKTNIFIFKYKIYLEVHIYVYKLVLLFVCHILIYLFVNL